MHTQAARACQLWRHQNRLNRHVLTYFEGSCCHTSKHTGNWHSLQISPTTVKIKSLNLQDCNANIKSSLQTSFSTIFFHCFLKKAHTYRFREKLRKKTCGFIKKKKKTWDYECCRFHYQFSDYTSYTEISRHTLPFVYLPVKQTVTLWIMDLSSALGKIFNLLFVFFLSERQSTQNDIQFNYYSICLSLKYSKKCACQNFSPEQTLHSLKRKSIVSPFSLRSSNHTTPGKLKLQFLSTQFKNPAPLIF